MPMKTSSSRRKRSQLSRTPASTAMRGAVPSTASPIVARLRLEELEAGHRDDRRRDALARRAPRPPRRRSATSEPVAMSVTSRALAGLADQIAAARRRGSRRSSLGAQRRQVLARQAEHRGRPRLLQRAQPGLRGLDRVGRAEHQEVRDGAQRRQMLDRLVRRAVLAEADRIVRHHVDDAACPSAPRAGSPGANSRRRRGTCRRRG